jgi:putative oxidoreductase
MRLLEPASSRWTDTLLSVLRIVAALLFMQHGAQKLFNFPPSGSPVPSAPFSLMSQMGLAGVLEFFGGMLLLFGLFTRPVAFILSGEMAWAYFQAHAPRGFFPIMNRGELPALYSFLFLYFAFAGGGRWSLDALLRRRRPDATIDR